MIPGIRQKLDFCYDMGFVLEPRIDGETRPRELAQIDSKLPIVGFNVSGLLYMGGYTGRNMFGLKGDYRLLAQDLIKHLIRKHKVKIMLLPHVIGSVQNSENDITACHKIYQAAGSEVQKHLFTVNEDYDQHELKTIIGACDFFIGSRMHACIGALSQCIPAVGLAYSRKFRGVFGSVGVEEMVIDLRMYDNDHIVENVSRMYERKTYFRTQLELKMPSVQLTARKII